MGKLETPPPCLTGEAIVFVNRPKAFSKDSSDIYLPIGREKSIDDVFQHLYLRLHPEIEFFYEACELRKEATELAWKIDERETKLLLCLKEFLATTWWHPLKRKKIVDQMKSHAIQILEGLSEYSSLARELKKTRSQIGECRASNDLFRNLVEKVGLDYYTKPEIVNSESVIKVIEHARSETETYSSSVSILVSTLTGAIIGSALTILVTYLLGFL